MLNLWRWAGLAVLIGMGGCVMDWKLDDEVGTLGLHVYPDAKPVTEADLLDLPAPAQRYFHFMGVVGRPRDESLAIDTPIRFRRAPDAPFAEGHMRQFNARRDVARVFHMQLPMFHLPVYVRDTYVEGHGHMQAKVFDVVKVVDEAGEKLDVGELVTYLNDAVMFAPSMLLVPAVAITPVDEHAFDVALTDRGTTVHARVFVDDRGAPVDFHTTDRFVTDPAHPKDGMVRAEWTTPMESFIEVDGRRFASRGRATWMLPAGPFTYAEMEVGAGDVRFNVTPGE